MQTRTPDATGFSSFMTFAAQLPAGRTSVLCLRTEGKKRQVFSPLASYSSFGHLFHFKEMYISQLLNFTSILQYNLNPSVLNNIGCASCVAGAGLNGVDAGWRGAVRPSCLLLLRLFPGSLWDYKCCISEILSLNYLTSFQLASIKGHYKKLTLKNLPVSPIRSLLWTLFIISYNTDFEKISFDVIMKKAVPFLQLSSAWWTMWTRWQIRFLCAHHC